MCPDGALVWNRTSIPCASGRRHHQIGYEDIVVAGVVPGHGHRQLFDCQRSRSLRNEVVRGRGVEPRRTGSKPVGLPLADPRAVAFRDGFERRHLRSERSGLPLADPGSRGPAGSRTPFARLRAECLAIKASDPHQSREVPSVGLEPTQSGLKGRCPSRWASTANDCRRRVFFPAFRIHASRWGS